MTCCYSCLGTGRIRGFGHTGQQCPCIRECGYCGEPIPHEDFSDGRPQRVDGVDCCPTCRASEEEV